jgi:signal transduction histidine kinase
VIENRFLSELLIQRRTLVKHLALLLGVISLAAMWWVILPEKAFSPSQFGLWTGVLILSVSVFYTVDRHATFARYLLILGVTGLFLAGLWLLPEPWLPLWGMVLIFPATMLVPGAGIAIALLTLTMALTLTGSGSRDYPIPFLVVSLLLSTATSLVLAYTLYTTLQWYENSQAEMARLLRETREQRATLRQTLKSLNLSYDIQERMKRRLAFALEKAETIQQMKERFAANISHELRTPLNIVMGFSELMHLSPGVYGDVNWQPTLRRDVYQIYRSSQHLLKMIDDILDLARFEQTRFTINREPTPMTAMMNDTLEIAHDIFKNHPVTFTADIAPDLPVLEIDRVRIRQVLLNLLTNARSFTPTGAVRLEAKREADDVVIRLSDTGIGIAEEKQPYIFDDFYQVDYSLSRRHGGAGLGLAISKRFVEAHKGRIWVESRESEGSTFSFSLPIPRPGALEVLYLSREGARQSGSSTQPSILVVDADAAVAAMIDRQLEAYQIIQVEHPADLAEAIATYFPQFVIHNVPPGKTGELSTYAELPVPVIELSLPSQSWLTEELAVEACLTKPVSAPQLLKAIERLGDQVQDILVIDDDRGFVQLTERILLASDSPCRVRHAFDGQDGLALVRQQPPDAILLDLVMPKLDGFGLLDCLRQDARLAAIPVVVLTATSYAEDYLTRQTSRFSILQTRGLHMDETMGYLKAVAAVF